MKDKTRKRIIRHRRIRRKICGTRECPRFSVYRGLGNMHAQLINDIDAKTLLYVSTHSKEFKKKLRYGGNVQAARLLGEIIAQKAKEQKISRVIFDRGGFLYHGRVKALAESAREHGLKF